MNLQEAKQKMVKNMTLRKRIIFELWGVWFSLEHHFRRITKICPHDSTTGSVGGKFHYCLDCEHMIPNTEWKEERKAMRSEEH